MEIQQYLQDFFKFSNLQSPGHFWLWLSTPGVPLLSLLCSSLLSTQCQSRRPSANLTFSISLILLKVLETEWGLFHGNTKGRKLNNVIAIFTDPVVTYPLATSLFKFSHFHDHPHISRWCSHISACLFPEHRRLFQNPGADRIDKLPALMESGRWETEHK